MPFVERAASGAIVALFSSARSASDEWLDAENPQIQDFLSGSALPPGVAVFDGLDNEFIRVLEDVIDTLIEKNVLRLTDLPHEAQRKLLARKGLRHRLRDSLDLLSGGDVI